jgi:hypothetical protein
MSKPIKTYETDGHKVSTRSDLDLDLTAVLTLLPGLTYHGFGLCFPLRDPCKRRREVLLARGALQSPEALCQFEATKCWLVQHRPSGDSYRLKHVAEEAIGYISNGVHRRGEGRRLRRRAVPARVSKCTAVVAPQIGSCNVTDAAASGNGSTLATYLT